MIAKISQQDSANQVINLYQEKLKSAGFLGDIDTSYATRLVTSTDNSIYQQVPQAVLFPKSDKDIKLALEIAQQDPFLSLTFGPRGGGTGTNGQSLTPGIVIDLSRHMREILEINEKEGWVRVQAGVIKDQLNDFLRPYGYFFSPDLSTSNRATIGGMINTDASGQGSLVYGKTSDHVLGLKTFLVDGTELNTSRLAIDKAQLLAEQPGKVAEIYHQVIDICKNKRELILQKFPRLNRFLTGYDLENVFDDSLTSFDLSRIITGSEGSLGIVTEAKLNLTPIQPFKTLINIKYDSFESALRNSPFLVSARATSVETVDSKVLNLAKEDIIWHSVSDLITEVPGVSMQGLNMVEFNGESEEEIRSKVDSLCQRLDQLIANKEAGIIGYQLTNDKADILKIYAMRKKSVGLLGNVKGAKKPLAFAEDTAVPPENLADFIMEFRDLLDAYGLDYGMFGHVDAGVLHVRPALDMCDPEQEKLLRTISDEVVKLTAKYRGLMWGEHGKGYRSEYGPEFFGEELFTELRKIKGLFDKNNRLNPGKICTPLDSKDSLVSVDDQKRAWFDKQIPTAVKSNYEAPINCNGNGLCFNYDDNSPMCPSYKVTKDRRFSPKGRAGLFKEWLRLQTEKGIDLVATENQLIDGNTTSSWWQRLRNSRNPEDYDFSHEVKMSMDECLACKACTTACPIKVDVPTFRAKFLNFYYSRYNRPLKDYLVGNLEKFLPTMAKVPSLVNFIQNLPPAKYIIENWIGYIDSPQLSKKQLQQRIDKKFFYHPQQYTQLSKETQNKVVFIVQDPFTSFYEAELVSDFVELVTKLGFYPQVLPFHPNGKPQHVKGFLRQFKQTATNTSDFLNQISQHNRPLVGLDASLVMCYRDEYKDILQHQGDFEVSLAHEWLSTVELPSLQAKQKNDYLLLSHCTETTAMPESKQVWQQTFAHFGLTLQGKSTGCCGMAGTYGHEKQNQENSKALFASSWQPVIEQAGDKQVLATGFSCRCQVKRFSNNKPKHPIQILNQSLN